MDLLLKDKVAIVTGAGRGIGLATAQALRAEGAMVVGATRTLTEELMATATHCIALDLTTPHAADTVVADTHSRFGQIDIVVNGVGADDFTANSLQGFLHTPEDQWTTLLERNLLTTVRMAKATLPHLIDSGGSMINISSINAKIPAPGPVGYSEAKAALDALTKRLSEEFGPQGVRINAISPGPVGTRMWRDPNGFASLVANSMGASYEQFMQALPGAFGLSTGRLVEPEEIGALVAFLCSPVAANLVGANVTIDSGATKNI